MIILGNVWTSMGLDSVHGSPSTPSLAQMLLLSRPGQMRGLQKSCPNLSQSHDAKELLFSRKALWSEAIRLGWGEGVHGLQKGRTHCIVQGSRMKSCFQNVAAMLLGTLQQQNRQRQPLLENSFPFMAIKNSSHNTELYEH